MSQFLFIYTSQRINFRVSLEVRKQPQFLYRYIRKHTHSGRSPVHRTQRRRRLNKRDLPRTFLKRARGVQPKTELTRMVLKLLHITHKHTHTHNRKFAHVTVGFINPTLRQDCLQKKNRNTWTLHSELPSTLQLIYTNNKHIYHTIQVLSSTTLSYISIVKTRCRIFAFIEYHSTCFGRSFRPSPGVQDCTHRIRYMSYRLVDRLLTGTRWN